MLLCVLMPIYINNFQMFVGLLQLQHKDDSNHMIQIRFIILKTVTGYDFGS